MQVGCFGDITFSVSSNCIKTFTDLTWGTKANISEHSMAYGQAVAEFTGSALETVTMKIKLSAYLGVDSPLAEAEKLRNYARAGTTGKLVIGEAILGGLWIISEVNFTSKYYNKYGTPTDIEATLTLKEYSSTLTSSTSTQSSSSGIIT